jgi:hypothetical protein
MSGRSMMRPWFLFNTKERIVVEISAVIIAVLRVFSVKDLL